MIVSEITRLNTNSLNKIQEEFRDDSNKNNL